MQFAQISSLITNDKVIFSSPKNIPAGGMQSKVWKTFLNIDPVLLLYGSKKHNLSEEYGQIIECKYEEPPTSSIFAFKIFQYASINF